ncbi:MAG TPA: hypothetical protein DIU06_03015 [Rhodospirillaceae bacterium]|nr:hypothetical protein [Rhodospirillaceae bacterium]
MLDTIAINLQRDDYIIHSPERFTPNVGALTNPLFGDGGIVKCYYNPTKAEKAQGYLPRITVFKKPFGDWASAVWMKIEFSAPKLIFGNNFEELNGNEDFDRVIKALLEGLKRMGIETTFDALSNAKISAIHYSKNILLDRDMPCYLLIQTLQKLDISAKLDLNQTDFRNGGQMAKYHASTFEIAIYDKVKLLEQARKYGARRGAETDYDCQKDLFTGQKTPEVLRLEIRLQSRKLKSLIKNLGVSRKMTLTDLYCASLSRAVLMHYWAEITKGLYVLNINTGSCEKLIDNIRAHFPKKRPNTILALMGFVQTCQQVGIRGAKLLLGLNNSQFYRLKADAQKLEQETKSPHFAVLGAVKSQLKEFIPLVKEDIVDEDLLGK